ncbi:MAG: DUF5719 family protein [Aquiluna sp.]
MKIFARALLALLLPALVISGYVFLPAAQAPSQEVAAPEFQVSVDPADLEIVCAGALIEVGGEDGTDLDLIERVGEAGVRVFSAEEISVPPTTVASVPIEVKGSKQSTELLSAIQTQAVSRERASGLAASFCEQPITSGWFISGASGVGNESILSAANWSDVDTQLIVELYSPGGMVSERYALAAGQERLITLAPLAALASVYAIRVESTGPGIAVALQNRWSRGLTPLGVELSGTTQLPALQHWIQPVSVLAEGYQSPKLRLYSPGEAAEVVITAFGSEGPELFRTVVPEAGFAELDLELAAGTYLLKVESNVEVLAGVRNPALDPLDYAWIYPQQLFTSLALPVPSYKTTLWLANPGALAISLTLTATTNDRASYQTLELGPFESAGIPVGSDSLLVQSASEFLAALELLDGAGYAVIGPSENKNLGEDLVVSVR